MKTSFFIIAFIFLATSLFSQDPTVKIKLNGEERFRFEDYRLEFVNPHNNVLIGDSCGWGINGNPDAVNNVYIGNRAGYHNISGHENVFVGDSSGFDNTNGNLNAAVGSWSAWKNTDGSSNSFFGAASGAFNTNGNLNSYFGTFSGYENDTGIYNCFHGYAAGAYNHGSNNVFVGGSAGRYNKGDSSVMIGFRAGQNDTTSHKLYISNSESMNPLVYGEFDNRIIRFNANRVEIRNERENTFVGDSTGVNNEGYRNVFLGYHAGYSTTTSNDNIFIGDSAGYFTTTGRQNLFMGTWTGWSNTTGNSNVIIGYAAGIGMTEGSLNTMVGVNSGFWNTSGHENVFLGVSSGASNLTGSCNTYLGRRAGLYAETGDSSVFIGYYAGAKEQNSHRLYIANSDTTTPLIYGEFDNELLRIHGTLDIKGLYQFPITDGTTGQYLMTDGSGNVNWSDATGDFSNGGDLAGSARTMGNTDNYSLGILTNDIERLYIANDGKVGIGTNDPHGDIQINDHIVIDQTSSSNDYLISNNIFYDGDWRYIENGMANYITMSNSGEVNFGYCSSGTSGEIASLSNILRLSTSGNIKMGPGNPSGDQGIVTIASLDASNPANIRFTHGSSSYFGLGSNINQDFEVNRNTALGPDSETLFLIERSSGNVAVGSTDPTSKLDVSNSTGFDQFRMRTPYTPVDTDDTNGETGDMAWDDSYIYIKTSAGWKRAALETF